MQVFFFSILNKVLDQNSFNLRGELLNQIVRNPDDTVQREFIFSSLSDKSMSIREFAVPRRAS
ncbi:DUF5724 domain-containing protein [Paenibacillus sp. NPDC055715]